MKSNTRETKRDFKGRSSATVLANSSAVFLPENVGETHCSLIVNEREDGTCQMCPKI